MDITPDILGVLKYFHTEPLPLALFIRIGDEYAFSVDGEDGELIVGSTPIATVDLVINRWKLTHRIEIITERDDSGAYALPDIRRYEYEKEIDY